MSRLGRGRIGNGPGLLPSTVYLGSLALTADATGYLRCQGFFSTNANRGFRSDYWNIVQDNGHALISAEQTNKSVILRGNGTSGVQLKLPTAAPADNDMMTQYVSPYIDESGADTTKAKYKDSTGLVFTLQTWG